MKIKGIVKNFNKKGLKHLFKVIEVNSYKFNKVQNPELHREILCVVNTICNIFNLHYVETMRYEKGNPEEKEIDEFTFFYGQSNRLAYFIEIKD